MKTSLNDNSINEQELQIIYYSSLYPLKRNFLKISGFITLTGFK